jgi:DNA polymerase/3'-5' exonuclease PolX
MQSFDDSTMKKDLDPRLAMSVARDFLVKTNDLYARSEIAGSLRRNEPVVHDIDIVVIAKNTEDGSWKEKITRRVSEIGGEVISLGEVMSDFQYRGIQVNLFLCPSEDCWGPSLMWATGPKGHTIGMTIKARSKGLLINSQGIWTREKPPRLISARTERDVARILGWKYKPPEQRGKGLDKRGPSASKRETSG